MPAQVGQFIRDHRDVLLERWLEKVPERPRARTLSRDELLNGLSRFLEMTAESLLSSAEASAAGTHSQVARDHGSQRQALQQPLVDLVGEYGRLLVSVTELAEELGLSLSQKGLAALAEAIFEATAQAADQFVDLQQAARRKADFEMFAFLAHELRNPLSSARLAWQLLTEDQPNEGRPAKALTRSLDRLSGLIDESVKTLRARLEGVIELRTEEVDLGELFEELEGDSRSDADAKRITLVTEVAEGLSLQGDRRMLHSAVGNLVRNAVRFTHEGGRIDVKARPHGDDGIIIEIIDGCGGLPVTEANALFEPFRQAGADRSGLGLGLAIVKDATEAHGGVVRVENREPHGCRFVLELPRVQPTAAAENRSQVG